MTNTILFPGLGGIELHINPVAAEIFGRPITWYGIIIAAGFLLAAVYVLRRSEEFGLNEDIVVDCLIAATPVAIIFARLYYVVFNYDMYRDDPISMLYIWNGGIAIYGAIIGAVLAAAVFCKIRKVKIAALLDLVSFGFLIGQAIGRWGNFVNSEAYGEETTSVFRMVIAKAGMVMPHDLSVGYHPAFLYESAWNVLGFVLLHFYSKKRKFRGEIFLMYIAWYGLGRGMIEGLRLDSLYFFGTALRVSQFVGFFSFVVGAAVLIYNHLLKQHDREELLKPAFVPKTPDEKKEQAQSAEAGTPEAGAKTGEQPDEETLNVISPSGEAEQDEGGNDDRG